MWMACGSPGAVGSDRDLVAAEFVGTTPCDTLPRQFVGGMAVTAPCHCITWELTLLTNLNAKLPNTFKLLANYGLPGRNDPNQLEEGPRVEQQGTWKILKGTTTNPEAVVYQLRIEKHGQTLSAVKLGENLLHFLNPDKSLMVGNPGWNYTLSKKGIGKNN